MADTQTVPGTPPLSSEQDLIDLTVVIPTFNRRDRLKNVLERLDRQVTSTSDGHEFRFDVVVVSDGSTDGTDELLEELAVTYPLHLIRQANAGPAAARNAGIESAAADIVMFLDDDVMPEPHCLAAHFAHHRTADNMVVVGPMLTPTDFELQPWVRWEQFQLEKQYDRLRAGKKLYPRQFYTGNASARKAALIDAGLFDTTLLRAEDIELAQRMDLGGQTFLYEDRAEAYHHAERSFESWLKVAEDYGINDIAFAQAGRQKVYGEIRRFFSERSRVQQGLVRLVVPRPRLTAPVHTAIAAAARASDRVGAETLNRQLLSGVYGLRYYAGVADALGSPDRFLRLIDEGAPSLDVTTSFVPWMVLEQTLGHITHSKNLHRLIPRVDGVTMVSIPVDDSFDGWAARVPGWSNWTIRAGIRARRGLGKRMNDRSVPAPDALFVHSQVPAVLLGRWMKRHATVVSLDATPKQYDSLGEFYDHEVGSSPLERVKDAMNLRCYERAEHLVTWSSWAKDGLVGEYGIDPSKITVIAPGVDVDQWERPAEYAKVAGVHAEGPLRVLFVGGNLARKGGDVLLEANRILREDPSVPEFELHLVTGSTVDPEPGVVVHAGLTANAPELIEQYHLADVFCLPTYGDCLPMVLAEAGAAGLPLVSTDVAGIPGIVRDGETGRLVKPGDIESLVDALRDLLTNPERRTAYGRAARKLVEREHNAAVNAEALIGVLRAAAQSR